MDIEHEPWEYRLDSVANADIPTLTSRMNGIGADGWELVSVTSTVRIGKPNDMVLVFKRPGLGRFDAEHAPGFIAY